MPSSDFSHHSSIIPADNLDSASCCNVSPPSTSNDPFLVLPRLHLNEQQQPAMPYTTVARTRQEPFQLYYELHGTGPTRILFIMGLNISMQNWDHQYRYFGSLPGYTCLAFDNRGVGYSDSPPPRYTTSEMAKDAYELLIHVGWKENVHVVGVSMGGMIAQELALLAPEVVASLILTSTQAGRVLSPWEAYYNIPRMLTIKDPVQRMKEMIKVVYTDEWLKKESTVVPGKTNYEVALARSFERAKRTRPPTPRGALGQVLAASSHYVSPARLSQIKKSKVPVLVTTGTIDTLVKPWNSYYLAQQLNGKLKVFEGCGHALPSEIPEEYNKLLKGFIDQVERFERRGDMESTRLPIHEHETEILRQINSHRVCVISAETGAGKSTCVPIMIVQDAFSKCERVRILIAQPRRIATIRLAERVHDQLQKAKIRAKAGYRIMNEVSDKNAEIVFSTVGYMVAWLASNEKALSQITHVILDEAHERSVDNDLLTLLLRRRLRDSKYTFKVIVMSATLDTQLFADYFFCNPRLPGMSSVPRWTVSKPMYVGAKRFPVKKVFLDSLLKDPAIKELFADKIGADGKEIRPRPVAMNNVFAAEDMAAAAAEADVYSHVLNKWYDFERAVNNFRARGGPRGGNFKEVNPTLTVGDFALGVELALHVWLKRTSSKKSKASQQSRVKTAGDRGVRRLKGTQGDGEDEDEDDMEDAEAAAGPPPTTGECVLVFLPGEFEILTWRETLDAKLHTFGPAVKEKISVFVLHSQLQRAEMDQAFVPAKPGHLKIVLATNIAESSLTISDVTCVIDHGLRRSLELNPMGCQMLKLGWVSRASSKQREGRCGRCREGLFIALYTKGYHDIVFKEHDPAEISTIALEITILKVKALFREEHLRTVLNDLIEPPESEQLASAIKVLRETGAITKPKDEEAEEDDTVVTFLGSVIPRFACDIPQVRLMIFGAAIGIPCDAVVLAAAQVSQDPFYMPSSFVIRNREDLNFKLASSYAGRLASDRGVYSEPISYYNIFKDWLNLPLNKRYRWMQTMSIHSQRFTKFRVSIASMASKLADLLYEMSILPGALNVERSQGAKAANELRQLARVAMTRDDPNEQGVAPDRAIGRHILSASIDQMRTVIAAACANNIFVGLTQSTGTEALKMASEELAKIKLTLKILEKSTSKIQKKALAKLLNKKMTAELFSQSSASDTVQEIEQHLDSFRKYVPHAPKDIGIQLLPESLEGMISCNAEIYKTVESQLSKFDQARTVVLIYGRKTAPQARHAKTLRLAFEWMSCVRVLCTQRYAFLEFMRPQDRRVVDLSKKSSDSFTIKILKRMEDLNAEYSPKEKVEVAPPAENEIQNLTSALADMNLGTLDEALKPSIMKQLEAESTDSETASLRNVPTLIYSSSHTPFGNNKIDKLSASSASNTTNVKVYTSFYEYESDCNPAAKFMQHLTCGRPWAFWMPAVSMPGSQPSVGNGSYLSANVAEEGLEVGPIEVSQMVGWRKANFGNLSCRPYWRASLAGMASLRQVICVQVEVEEAPVGTQRVVKRDETIMSTESGPVAYAAAASFMILANTNTESVAFTGATLIPANRAVWNLRLLAFNVLPIALYLEDADSARMVNVYGGSDIEDRKFDSLEGGVFKREDLAIINDIRRRISLLLYRGDGVLLGERGRLAALVGAEMQALALKVVERGEADVEAAYKLRAKAKSTAPVAVFKNFGSSCHWVSFRHGEHEKIGNDHDHMDALEAWEREQASMVFGGLDDLRSNLGGAEDDWAVGMMTQKPATTRGGIVSSLEFTFKSQVTSSGVAASQQSLLQVKNVEAQPSLASTPSGKSSAVKGPRPPPFGGSSQSATITDSAPPSTGSKFKIAEVSDSSLQATTSTPSTSKFSFNFNPSAFKVAVPAATSTTLSIAGGQFTPSHFQTPTNQPSAAAARGPMTPLRNKHSQPALNQQSLSHHHRHPPPFLTPHGAPPPTPPILSNKIREPQQSELDAYDHPAEDDLDTPGRDHAFGVDAGESVLPTFQGFNFSGAPTPTGGAFTFQNRAGAGYSQHGKGAPGQGRAPTSAAMRGVEQAVNSERLEEALKLLPALEWPKWQPASSYEGWPEDDDDSDDSEDYYDDDDYDSEDDSDEYDSDCEY
ncbi:hypothetical protein HDV05_000283 [Chytridiales sp. JEL 0842]|nr:hypothetical protein HDV05_000283 [Chytridiales sp. JEL 0842]